MEWKYEAVCRGKANRKIKENPIEFRSIGFCIILCLLTNRVFPFHTYTSILSYSVSLKSTSAVILCISGVTIFLSSLPFLNATYITSSSSSKLSDTISLLSFISHSILLFVKTVGIGVTVGPAVGVAVGLDVTVGIGTVVGIAVGLGVTVGTIVGVAVAFTVGVAVGLGVAVGTVVGVAVDVAVGVGTVVGVAVGFTVGVAVGAGTVVGVAVGVAVGIIALTALYAFNLPPLITLPVSAESLSELEHKVSLISFAEIFGFTARITATALATIGVAIEVPDIVP